MPGRTGNRHRGGIMGRSTSSSPRICAVSDGVGIMGAFGFRNDKKSPAPEDLPPRPLSGSGPGADGQVTIIGKPRPHLLEGSALPHQVGQGQQSRD